MSYYDKICFLMYLTSHTDILDTNNLGKMQAFDQLKQLKTVISYNIHQLHVSPWFNTESSKCVPSIPVIGVQYLK